MRIRSILFLFSPGNVRIGVARPSSVEYDEEGTGESPPDTGRYSDGAQFERESKNH